MLGIYFNITFIIENVPNIALNIEYFKTDQ